MVEGKTRKRVFEGDHELDEFSSVDLPRFAKVHGVVMSASPMHKSASGCCYFDGKLSDGERSL